MYILFLFLLYIMALGDIWENYVSIVLFMAYISVHLYISAELDAAAKHSAPAANNWLSNNFFFCLNKDKTEIALVGFKTKINAVQ